MPIRSSMSPRGSTHPVPVTLAAALLLPLAGPTATAQLADPAPEAEPPAETPTQSPAVTPAEQIIEPVPDASSLRSSPVVPGQPTLRDALPGLGGADVRLPPSRIIREGAFIVRRSGVVFRAPTGEWIVVFASDPPEDGQEAPARGLPPMVLLPSRALHQMQRTLAVHRGQQESDAPAPPREIPKREPVAVELSGEVLVYHQRNYLLPTVYRFLDVQPSEHPEATSPSQETPGPPADGVDPVAPDAEDAQPAPLQPQDDPRVAELIEQLEQGEITPVPRPIEPPEPPTDPDADAGEAEDAPARASLLEDGRMLVRVRGHLSRLGDGTWAFTPNSDPESPEPGPMPILPCQALEHAERLVQRGDLEVPVIVSGQVHAYEQARYLLPRSVLRTVPSDITPHQ